MVIEDICKCLKLVSGFCLCPRRLFRCVIFVNVSGVAYWRAATGSILLLSASRFRSFALRYDFRFYFRPSWQVNLSVITCVLIDWVTSLLPRGVNERWSWQIPFLALISQCAQFQNLTANVSEITPAKKVEILRLSKLISLISTRMDGPNFIWSKSDEETLWRKVMNMP